MAENNTNNINAIINSSNTNINSTNNNNLSVSEECVSNLNTSRIQQKKIKLEKIIKNTTISSPINFLKSIIKKKCYIITFVKNINLII